MMKHKAMLVTLVAAFATAPAVYAADPNSPDTTTYSAEVRKDDAKRDAHDMKDSAKQTAHDAKNSAKNAANETGEFLSDSALTTKVKASLLTEKNLKSLGIDVDTKDGVVTLNGTVPSAAEKKQAEDVARHVKGVKDVKNSLTLKAS